MDNPIKKTNNNSSPSNMTNHDAGSSSPETVNQYGDHPVYIEHADNVNLPSDNNSVDRDENGRPLVPITPTRFDRARRIIHIGNENIQIPIELGPLPDDCDLPYINALCEVYAEKLERQITPQDLDSLPPKYKKDLEDQRRAFYSAESLKRSVRDVFGDGEEQFNNLEDDAYEGILPVYRKDSYPTGYDRLLAVLGKITTITLSLSSLTNIVSLIGNLEKKGICHILVNDERIKSWVNIDNG